MYYVFYKQNMLQSASFIYAYYFIYNNSSAVFFILLSMALPYHIIRKKPIYRIFTIQYTHITSMDLCLYYTKNQSIWYFSYNKSLTYYIHFFFYTYSMRRTMEREWKRKIAINTWKTL